MFEQIIKQRSNACFEEGPEPLSIRGDGSILKHGRETDLEFIYFSVNPSEHFGIETKFIPKVAKDQGLVKARDFRNAIDPRTIVAVLREDSFSSIENRLTRLLSTAPSRF